MRRGEAGQVEEKLKGIKSEEEDNNDIPRCSHYIIAGRLQPSIETSPLDQISWSLYVLEVMFS